MFRLLRLMTVAPGHFHAALVQKRALHGVHHRTHVYAPLDGDTLAHLARVAAFNARGDHPTAWDVDLRAGPDYRERFAREQPGNAVVLSGRNRSKIDLMALSVENNLPVLADKPWIIEPADFPKLEALFAQAELREGLVWDMLTERFEITNWLLRELARDAELFGEWQAGTPEHPALWLKSVHLLKKSVNGQPLVRPWWWFSAAVSGEALTDVGTHLADLSIWLTAPDQPIHHATQVRVLAAERALLLLTQDQFGELTGLPAFPPELGPHVAEGNLYYGGFGSATYVLRGVHVKFEAAWEYEDPTGGDAHQCVARGTRATALIRQAPGALPQLFFRAAAPARHGEMVHRLSARCATFQRDIKGLAVEDLGTEARVLVPDNWRTSHEDHFAEVMGEFVRYFHAPRAVPAWERANALTRYYITTRALELARAPK
ncbi:MAG TPA: putative oxidoreductase C-terminal domain-containing protein [Gemmata sp.]